MKRRSRLAARPRLERLDARVVLSALTPAQVDTAYGLNAITFKSGSTTIKGDGTGQTIAIVDAFNDPNIATEIATFDKQYSLPAASLTVDNLAGSGNNNAGWAEEEALDVEWAHVSAPGAKIVLIEATSDSTTALIAGVNAARSMPTVSVVSMSWGGSDSRGETSLDGTFTTPAGHIGITFLAAAGDSPGAEWPADSPNVIAVGGTSLTVTSSGARVSETGWNSGGGGTSRVEAEPAYQKSVQTTGYRTSPDVSAVANPNTGVEEYSVAAGGWVQVGGTSLSTPIWAGLIAIADQGRVLAGKTSLDGATQALPDLYAAPSADFNALSAGSHAAVAAYNTTTGLGSPKAAALVASLVADPAIGSATATITSTNTTATNTTTTTTPATPVTPAPTPPPFGGHWGGWFGGLGGYYFTSQAGGWTGPSVSKNSGQAAPTGLAPIVPITYSAPVPSGPSATTTGTTTKPGKGTKSKTTTETATEGAPKTSKHHVPKPHTAVALAHGVEK